MTAVTAAVVTPVHGALAVQRGELWVAGLPDTCPTCGGDQWVPVTDNVRKLCPDCTTGHLLVSGPMIILSTDGHIQGTATNVTPYPIVGPGSVCPAERHVVADRLPDGVWVPAFECGAGEMPANIHRDTSFGLWEPGGVAYHFTGIRPEIDCQQCVCGHAEADHHGQCDLRHRLNPAYKGTRLEGRRFLCACPGYKPAPFRCPISYPSAPVEPCITQLDPAELARQDRRSP